MTYQTVLFRADSINVSGSSVVSTANLTFAGDFNHTVNTTMNLEDSWTGKTATIIKNGTGTLLLKGGGTYNGTTTVNAGIIRIQNGASLGTGAVAEVEKTDIQTGAALEVDGTLNSTEFIRVAGTGISTTGAIRAISGTSAFNSQIAMEGIGGAVVSFGAETGATIKVARLYSDPGRDTNFEKVGAGRLVLKSDSSDDYVGTTTITGGILQVGDADLTGELKISGVINNASLVFNRSLTFNGGNVSSDGTVARTLVNSPVILPTTISLGDLTNNGVITLSGALNIDTDKAINPISPITFSGDLSGNGAITKTGTALLTFSGTSSYSGAVSVNTGILKFQKNTATPVEIAAGALITVANGATVQIQ